MITLITLPNLYSLIRYLFIFVINIILTIIISSLVNLFGIVFQLEERQLRKKDDLEKKKQEDLAEERRIKKQQEIEKKRIDDEMRRQREKEVS